MVIHFNERASYCSSACSAPSYSGSLFIWLLLVSHEADDTRDVGKWKIYCARFGRYSRQIWPDKKILKGE